VPVKRLDDAGRAQLRERLAARSAQLGREVREALHTPGGGAAGLPNRSAEVDDDAIADLESGLDVASLERDARELEDITRALARLDAGTYGDCQDCGQAIAWERLQAQPQATRCLACAERAERGEPPAARL